MPSVINQFLASVYRQRFHENASEMARFLDEPVQSVHNWIELGRTPRFETLARVMEKLGGDLTRALPTYDPFVDVMQQMVGSGIRDPQIEITGPVLRSRPSAEKIATMMKNYLEQKNKTGSHLMDNAEMRKKIRAELLELADKYKDVIIE